jgi:hypothetical protein
MPSIYDIASHFDDIAITDGYTGAPLYYGQFSSFLESSPDGSTSQRRTLSLAPGLALPARKVITALSEQWIVGMGNVDGIYGMPIRQSFWMKKASGSYAILTPAQAALNSAGITAYGHKLYLKDTVNGASDSEYDPFYNFYFSTSEPVTKGSILRFGTLYYYVRATNDGLDGLTEAGTDELDTGAYQSVTFTSTGAYNPVTDTYSAGSTATTGILMDRYMLYQKRTEADQQSLAGDMSLLVATSAVTPVVGKLVTISSRSWKILAVTAEQDAWLLHIRRA